MNCKSRCCHFKKKKRKKKRKKRREKKECCPSVWDHSKTVYFCLHLKCRSSYSRSRHVVVIWISFTRIKKSRCVSCFVLLSNVPWLTHRLQWSYPSAIFLGIVCTRLSNSDGTEMVLPGKRACLVLKARSAHAHLTRSSRFITDRLEEAVRYRNACWKIISLMMVIGIKTRIIFFSMLPHPCKKKKKKKFTPNPIWTLRLFQVDCVLYSRSNNNNNNNK